MESITIWMIIGFLLAAYSVVSNDSVQTLGTFIASNQKIKWYYLWAFTSVILLLTISYSWYVYNGDVAFGRLTEIPFIEPQWYHALAPLALVILTRVGIPVSTSLLVLSAFASSLVFEKILIKSAVGYGLAAVTAYGAWLLLSRWDEKSHPIAPNNASKWRVFQWCSTGFLWFSWLSHDMANIAVFLPRQLNVLMLALMLTILIGGLGYTFRAKGGKIQHIVMSKTNTTYVRSATFVDLFYAFLLVFFKEYNDLPMSTTWVFVGLLCGRELAIATVHSASYKAKDVFPIIGKDMIKLLFGLGVSVVIAVAIQNREWFIVLFS